MSYVFNETERAQVLAAIDASTGLLWNEAGQEYEAVPFAGADAVPMHQTLSELCGS